MRVLVNQRQIVFFGFMFVCSLCRPDISSITTEYMMFRRDD